MVLIGIGPTIEVLKGITRFRWYIFKTICLSGGVEKTIPTFNPAKIIAVENHIIRKVKGEGGGEKIRRHSFFLLKLE